MTLTIFSIIVSYFLGRHFTLRKQKINEKIDELQANVDYLRKIRAKPIELIRHAFTKIFLILFLTSFSLFIPTLFEFVKNSQILEAPPELITSFQFLFSLACVAISYWTFQTFNDVVNYEKAVKKHKKKIEKLNLKIKNI